MRVQNRLLLIVILLVITLLVGVFALQQNQRSQLAIASAQRRVELESLFGRLLTLEQEEVSTLAIDYTYWDEMVDFVTNRDPIWARDILENALTNYKINAIWIYNPHMELVYQTTDLPGGIAPPIPLSDEALADLFQRNFLTTFSFRAPDNQIIQVFGATIHPSNDAPHATPPQGYFFVGRAWLPQRLNHISEISGAQVTIAASEQKFPANALPDEIVVYSPIVTADGSPLAYLRASFNNTFSQGFLEAQRLDLMILSAVFVALFFLLAAGVILWVITPLGKISASLQDSNPLAIQMMRNDSGEFGKIARLIADFFAQKQAMAEQIQSQKETETALRLSEQRYRMITQVTSDFTYAFTIRSTGEITAEWDPELITRITGSAPIRSNDPQSVIELLHPQDRAQIPLWVNSLRGLQQVEAEIRILDPDGEARWVYNKMVPVQIEGQELRVYGAARDITAQRMVEEAYRSLVDQSPLGFSIIQNNRLVFANPALSQMVGLSREALHSLQPDQIRDLVHPEDLQNNAESIQAVLNGDLETARLELRLRHADRSWRWMNVTSEQSRFQDRPALQIVFEDVTTRKEAQSALAEQREYSAILFNTVSSLVLVIDPRGRITTLNPTAQAMLSPTCALQSHPFLWDCFSIPSGSPISADRFIDTINRQEVVNNTEIVLYHPNTRHSLAWSHSYQLDRNGNVVALVGTAVDITEGRMRERQQEAVAGIAIALRGTTTRKETILTILATIREFMEAHTVSMVFPLAETAEMVVEAALGDLAPDLEGARMSEDNSVAGEVLRKGKPYLSNNPREEKNFCLKGLLDRMGPTAWAPLISEDKPVGLLIISRDAPLSPADLEQLQPVADMAAGAIDRATRSEQAQKRIQQLSALQSINLAIGASLDLRLTLNVLAVQMTSQLGVDAVAVFMRNPDTKLLRCTAYNGFRSTALENLQLWEGEGQAGKVAMERRSRHLYDPDGIARYFIPSEIIAGEDFVAYDAAPLVVKGEVKGVIEAFHRPPYNASGEWVQLLEALALETAIAIDNAELLEKLQRSNQDLKIAYDTTIEGWARSLEQFGVEWGLHSRRVVDLTVKLAQWMGISGSQLTNIRYGALLHDIGKIGVPLSILEKPAKLTPEEWAVVKKHPEHAFAILHDIPFLRPALDIPYRHHERWNGSGYPDGLKGEEIPLAARIFAVVDIFDALTNKRPYREVWGEEESLAYIRDTAGKEIDPHIARAFLEMYPILGRSRAA